MGNLISTIDFKIKTLLVIVIIFLLKLLIQQKDTEITNL